MPILIAASLVSATLGSIHGFSVFVAPLEAQFGAARSTVSLTYSLALVSLTIAVLLGPRVYHLWSAARLMVMVSVLASVGAIVAGVAGSLGGVWLGYSLLFGAANGLGYGFGLQIAGQANPGREGLAMGGVTAAYALGAILSAPGFDALVTRYGFLAAMLALAGVMIVTGSLSALILWRHSARYKGGSGVATPLSVPNARLILLWLGYFGGVLSGLMVIGHASGIAISKQPGSAAWIAPAIIAICNLAGSLIAGRLADWAPPGKLLIALPAATAGALIGLSLVDSTVAMMLVFGVVGFAYGGTIAVYPAAISKMFGNQFGPRIYGRVFTAWGTAGLLGPWSAGMLFDTSGGYGAALVVAAAFAIGSVIAAFQLFRDTAK